jgi:hypothetical protein
MTDEQISDAINLAIEFEEKGQIKVNTKKKQKPKKSLAHLL